MKYLIDAQLPPKTSGWLGQAGGDAIHTLDMPDGNRTSDADIIGRADLDGRAVVTKDEDFVDSHLLSGQPSRLLLVSTGNISNADLERLVVPLLPQIAAEFTRAPFWN